MLTFEIIAVLIFTSLLLHRYGNWRQQSVFVSFFALIGWSFAFLTVVILPTDIAEAIYKQCVSDIRGKSNYSSGVNSTPDCGGGVGYLPENTLKNFWRVVYYTSQILTWFCLPLLQTYSGAGEFTVLGKLRTALKENLIFYSSYFLLAGVLLVYLAAKGLSLNP